MAAEPQPPEGLQPKISDEEVRALAFVIAKALPRITHVGDDGARTFYADLFARMLAEAGWRREADVLREAAEEIRDADSFNYGDEDPEDWQAIVAAHLEMRANIRERYPAGVLEPVGALPVAAEQLEPINCNRCGNPVSRPMPADVVVRAWVECPECVAGTPTTEGQERSEEQAHG